MLRCVIAWCLGARSLSRIRRKSLPPRQAIKLELSLGSDKSPEPSRRKRWSWMLAHVFLADLDTCCRCGGPMRWVRAARTEAEAARLMAELDLAPQPPPVAHQPPLGQLALPF